MNYSRATFASLSLAVAFLAAVAVAFLLAARLLGATTWPVALGPDPAELVVRQRPPGIPGEATGAGGARSPLTTFTGPGVGAGPPLSARAAGEFGLAPGELRALLVDPSGAAELRTALAGVPGFAEAPVASSRTAADLAGGAGGLATGSDQSVSPSGAFAARAARSDPSAPDADPGEAISARSDSTQPADDAAVVPSGSVGGQGTPTAPGPVEPASGGVAPDPRRAKLDLEAGGRLSPEGADWDGDAMSDAWERRHLLDPTRPDGAADPDGDGVRNVTEFNLGDDPRRGDSDDDGITDGKADPDGDGLTNAVEDQVELDPALGDTDGNGPPDGEEDRDGDGVANGMEVFAGLDPKEPDAHGHKGRDVNPTFPAEGSDDPEQDPKAMPRTRSGRGRDSVPDESSPTRLGDRGDVGKERPTQDSEPKQERRGERKRTATPGTREDEPDATARRQGPTPAVSPAPQAEPEAGEREQAAPEQVEPEVADPEQAQPEAVEPEQAETETSASEPAEPEPSVTAPAEPATPSPASTEAESESSDDPAAKAPSSGSNSAAPESAGTDAGGSQSTAGATEGE